MSKHRHFLKREKMMLIFIIGGISVILIALLFFCPKTESLANGILNILSGIVGSVTTILVQKTNKGGDIDFKDETTGFKQTN